MSLPSDLKRGNRIKKLIISFRSCLKSPVVVAELHYASSGLQGHAEVAHEVAWVDGGQLEAVAKQDNLPEITRLQKDLQESREELKWK